MATLILTILFAVIVAICALVGVARGLNKSVIRIMTLVLAVILTFVIAGPVTTAIAQNVQLGGMTLGEMILDSMGSEGMIADLLESMPLMREAILVAPAFALSLVVFPLMFLLVNFIFWLVYLFTQKPLRKLIFKDTGNKEEAAAAPIGVRVGKRFAGLGIGIVVGVLIFGMLMAPLFGLFSILPSTATIDGMLSTMAQKDLLPADDADAVVEIYSVTDCTLVQFYRLIGIAPAGKAYINSVSKIEADGQTLYLAEELGSLLSVVQTSAETGLLDTLMNSEDDSAIFALLADKDAMDTLMKGMFRSKLLSAAVPEVMAIAMESVANTMNVPANKEVVYNNMMDDIALAVKNAGIDYAAIKAYEDAHSITYRLARSAAQKTGDAAQTMTQEEYDAQIQKLLALAESISDILDRSISGDNAAFADRVADHIVNEVKAQASNDGQTVLESFDASSVQSAISSIDPSDIDADDADELLGQLTDPEKFETDVATVETIKESIRESVKDAVSDESKAEETAGTLASVVSDFAGAVSAATDENGNLDASKLDFEKVASAVTSLQNSTLKDVGSSVLDIVASSDLGSNSLMSDVLGAVKEGYENGEDIGGAIGTAGSLINLGTAMGSGDEGNQEAMVDSLTSLINNLNDYTISLLPSILTTDTITSMGVPAEYADATYSVIETLFKELMKLKGADDYTNEVNSILSLYNLATSGVEQFTEEDVGELVGYAMDSDAIFNTLVSVSTSNPFGIQVEDEADRESLADAIEDQYNKSGKSSREREIYTAVARLLGVDDVVDLA